MTDTDSISALKRPSQNAAITPAAGLTPQHETLIALAVDDLGSARSQQAYRETLGVALDLQNAAAEKIERVIKAQPQRSTDA